MGVAISETALVVHQAHALRRASERATPPKTQKHKHQVIEAGLLG